MDFASLGFGGIWANVPRMHCKSCGKLAGFDDFVDGALSLGFHDRNFIVSTLENRGKDTTTPPPHPLQCMDCKTVYTENGPDDDDGPTKSGGPKGTQGKGPVVMAGYGGFGYSWFFDK
jgi:hypothetical protein